MPKVTRTQGIIYIVFGTKAADAARNSILSLHKVNPKIKVCIVGDERGEALAEDLKQAFLKWTGADPYDPTRAAGFQFRAGRVKPFLYGLSPFEKTLYVDADTEFQADPSQGFDLLDQYDFMIAKHSTHTVGMLTPDKQGQERTTTIAEMGGGDQIYPNSGVLFWRDSGTVKDLFEAWGGEWNRFREWDEQLALMRALYKHPLRLLILPEAWNGENRKEGTIIFHDFHGTQVARQDVTPTLAGTFSTIYTDHRWPSKESVSGPGSEISHTERLREWLPQVIRLLGATSILDAGCGDWNWASQIELFNSSHLGIEYHGCDIVPDLIKANAKKYPGHHFFVADLTCDHLPQVDVILCRSVLFHLSQANVKRVLTNFQTTGAKWLLTTTFPFYRDAFTDIQDGRFHRLNLEMPPFKFPIPHILIPEGNEPDGWLGLWKLGDL